MGAVYREPAAENVGRSAKRAKPEAVADHGDEVTADLLVVFGRQQTPAHGRNTEHRKEFPGYELNGGQLRLAFTIDKPVHPCDPAHRSHTIRGWHCASKLLEYWIRKLCWIHNLIRRSDRPCRPRDEQLFGIPDRQRPKHQRIQHREEGAVDTNAQRKRENDCDHETRAPAECADCIPHVLGDRFDKRQPAQVAILFLDGLQAAELPARGRASIVDRHAVPHVFFDQQIKMRVNLVVQVGVGATLRE